MTTSARAWIAGVFLVGTVAVCAATTSGPAAPYSLGLSALKGAQTTDVYLQVFSNDPNIPVPSTAKKIQLKALNFDGSVQWTNNYSDVTLDSSGTAHYQYANLQDNQIIAAQVSLQTPQIVRCELTRSQTTDLLRPNIQIDATGPNSGFTNQPVQVQASFTETNGQTGATFDAVLLADGVEVDRVSTISIGAGGSAGPVTLTATFGSAGGHGLDIKVDKMNPAPYQPIAPVHFDLLIADPTPPPPPGGGGAPPPAGGGTTAPPAAP